MVAVLLVWVQEVVVVSVPVLVMLLTVLDVVAVFEEVDRVVLRVVVLVLHHRDV